MERKWYASSDRRLPRSGTTLIERIYGTLPGTRLSNETDNLSAILLVHSPVEGSDGFERAAAVDFSAVAAEYRKLADGCGRDHRKTAIQLRYLIRQPYTSAHAANRLRMIDGSNPFLTPISRCRSMRVCLRAERDAPHGYARCLLNRCSPLAVHRPR